jgi:hypothetical protein
MLAQQTVKIDFFDFCLNYLQPKQKYLIASSVVSYTYVASGSGIATFEDRTIDVEQGNLYDIRQDLGKVIRAENTSDVVFSFVGFNHIADDVPIHVELLKSDGTDLSYTTSEECVIVSLYGGLIVNDKKLTFGSFSKLPVGKEITIKGDINSVAAIVTRA